MIPKNKLKLLGINLLLLLGTIIFIFILLEMGLRLFFPQTLSIAQFDQNCGLEMKPNQEIMFYNELFIREFGHTVRTNSEGLREDQDYSPEKGDKYRIISIGDSFTFGNGVEVNGTFSKLLEAQLKKDNNNIEVINFGVSGIDLSEYYQRLEHKGPEYQPDLVLINIFVGNDFNTEVKTEDYVPEIPAQWPYWLASKSHAFKFSYVLTTKYFGKVIYNALLGKEKEALPYIYSGNEPYQNNLNSFLKAVPEFNKLAKNNNSGIIYVIIPTREQVDDTLWQKFLSQHGDAEKAQRFLIQEDLKRIFKETGSEYIDLTPYLVQLNQNNSFYYNIDGHFNKEGHRLASLVLYQRLKEKIMN